MCTLKGTTDGNWGDICVLAVGDLYQLPPVAHSPIYMSPQTVHTLNDIAPNGWEKDMKSVKCLNKIHTTVPLVGSNEDIMLQNCELKMNPSDDKYPSDALHVYARNAYCDEWNTYKLKLLPGKEFTNIATDSKKMTTELANITMPTNPCETGNLKKFLL